MFLNMFPTCTKLHKILYKLPWNNISPLDRQYQSSDVMYQLAVTRQDNREDETYTERTDDTSK